MKMYDIEDNIMKCWSIVDDLRLLGFKEIASLYDKKFEALFQAYECVLKEKYEQMHKPNEVKESLNEYPEYNQYP